MSAQRIWHPYCGAAPTPSEWLDRWNFDPILLLALVSLALAYQFGFRGVEAWRHRRFAAAFLLLMALYISPLCALSSGLFLARVGHHALIAVAVAPLLVAALPACSLPVRGSLATWTAAQAIIFWLWHSPALYAWALSNDPAYWLMQLSLLGSAIGFWAAVRRAEAPAAVAALLASMIQMGLLGALITSSASALYAPHFASTQPWGLTPLEDQQIAGLIMWVPAAAVYLAAALVLVERMLRSAPRRLFAR